MMNILLPKKMMKNVTPCANLPKTLKWNTTYTKVKTILPEKREEKEEELTDKWPEKPDKMISSYSKSKLLMTRLMMTRVMMMRMKNLTMGRAAMDHHNSQADNRPTKEERQERRAAHKQMR